MDKREIGIERQGEREYSIKDRSSEFELSFQECSYRFNSTKILGK